LDRRLVSHTFPRLRHRLIVISLIFFLDQPYQTILKRQACDASGDAENAPHGIGRGHLLKFSVTIERISASVDVFQMTAIGAKRRSAEWYR
jgi:hypothetical protein